MKRPNITPGEWTACIGHAGERFNIECRGTYNDLDPVATCKGSDRKANARAIAAVPDLLAALETALSVIEDDVLACERSPYPCAATQEAAIARKRARLTKAKDALTKAGYEFP